MRKAILVMLTVLILASLSSCGTNAAEESETMQSPELSGQVEYDTVEDVKTFQWVAADIAFSVPDYYEKDEEKTADDKAMAYRSTKGDLVGLFFVEQELEAGASESWIKRQIEQEGGIEETIEELVYTMGIEDLEEINAEFIYIDDMLTLHSTQKGRVSGLAVTVKLDIIYNFITHKVANVLFAQVGNLQYDYIGDYEHMVETAVLSESAAEYEEAPSVIEARTEFREVIDSYEAFFDEYIVFMKKYTEADDTTDMEAEYSAFEDRYREIMAALGSVDRSKLSDEDLKAYLEAIIRINMKMAEGEQYKNGD